MRRSLRRRILLVLLLAQGLLTATAATAVVVYTRHQMLTALEERLHRRMQGTLTMVQNADEQPGGVEFSGQPDAIPKDHLYAVWNSKGGLVASSPQSADALRTAVIAGTDVFFDRNGRTYLGAIWHSVPVLDDEDDKNGKADQTVARVDLAYALPADRFRIRFAGVIVAAVIGSTFFLAVSSLIAWYSVSRGLVPLNELATQASRITERFWDFRAEPGVEDIAELLPLTSALDGLIGRLKSAFERERMFVGDAAHELKTAVAIQKSTLQVTVQGPEDLLEYRKGFDQALADVDRLEALVLRMLSLASVEASTYEPSFCPVSLDETLLSASEQLSPLAELREVRIDTSRLASCAVLGDAGLLTTLWTALLENAIQHSPKGDSVIVMTNAFNVNTCRVYILDRGEGIAPEALPRIFDRFYRTDRSRSRETGGHGLGLAISKAIVERHRGTIVLESVPGRGTTVTVELPSDFAEHK